MPVRVVDAADEHLRYLSLCTHLDADDPDHMRAAEIRGLWLKDQSELYGVRTKVAVGEDGKPLGFIHMIPIDSPISGMIGRDLMVIPCLTINYQLVYAQKHGTGVGGAMVQACEKEARYRGFKGLAVYAYSGGFWFMPSAFFQKLGFRRVSEGSNIWVKSWADVEDPSEPRVHYEYTPVPGKVVIEYFWLPFCFTVCKEVINIREVASEFGDKVELREHRADDPETPIQSRMLRALYINGERRDWGYEAPKEELRKEIRKALHGLSWS